MRTRLLTLFLTICLVFTMLPVSALAEGSVTTVTTATELGTAMSATGTGDVVALGGDISTTFFGLSVARNVTLDLNGYNLQITVDSGNGIVIGSGVTLTIRDSSNPSKGKLIVKNTFSGSTSYYSNTGAAIKTTDGTLVIESGTVTATGGHNGAGIGGGADNGGGTVNISGGTVTATGGTGSAGIGCGNYGSGGTVTISGGTVTANGGNRGVGIGGGANGAGGTVNITGGTVTATGKNGGAGIGGGSGGSGGTLTISGGTVTATGSTNSYDGSSGAGIGGGSGGSDGSGGTLKISGGSVKANNMTVANAAAPVDSDGNPLELATLTLKEGSPLYKAALDNAGHTIRSGAGSLYPYGTTGVMTDANGRVYFYLPADTYHVSLQAGGKPYVNNSVEVASGSSNQAVLSIERILESISPPAAVTGVANGTAKNASALGLPANVTLVTDIGSVSAGVAWDVDACSYDPASIAEQAFTVNGMVTLPDSVLNPNGVSLNVSISVTVKAKPNLISITPPAAITGVANGTEKTASALGLPVNVTLVTDDGSVSAGVTWDVDSCSYDPASTAEQTFMVNGTVALPDSVINPSGVSLNVSISVTVNARPITGKTLISITPPAANTGVANGTAKTASALGLPANVTLVTDDGSVSTGVVWDVDSCSYDPASTAEQTFMVNGTVTLPVGVINPDGVPLNVSVSVTVNAAAAPSTPPAFSTRTLTDTPTGLAVSGALSRGATLRVNSFTPARDTTDPALAAIRSRLDSLEDTLVFCADITVSGNYSGPLTLSFEVGEQYNGQTVTLLHAKNGKLMTYTAVVKNGTATFTVTSLSPFALFAPVNVIDAVGIPKTGDEGARYVAIAVLVMAALAVGTVVHTWRKYKKG